jgi:alginate O-acetyltransferase complex protein AlgI
MLFNSPEFLFAFLPAALAGFCLLGSVSRVLAIYLLMLVSLVFYAWWRPVNVLIIAPAIIVNFVTASVLLWLNDSKGSPNISKTVLLIGILFNVGFLGFFKYTDFVFGTIDDVFGMNLVLRHIILPLGISFITFQKIAFLVDVQAGRVKAFTLRDYCTFVLFFPQLIAGPIVHYREMMPQFHALPCRFDKENFAVGVTLLSLGLFKKIVLADKIALLVTPIYQQSAAVGETSFLMAWMAATGFTLQIYFDFSGYSDMALGLGRFFGIRLPQNFDSPLRATSIIDFWLRWHMTLTRFLTAYVYNPLQLWLTRRRLAKGRRGFGGPNTELGAFLSLLMAPTILTMFVSGLWHGAGYGFIVWGLLHGFYLTINHGWRAVAARLWPDRKSYILVMKPVGWVLTFVSVTAAMVLFRSTTITSAADMMKGLAGLNGIALPEALFDRSGPLGGVALHRLGIVAASWDVRDFAKLAIWISGLMVVALACPNTLQILSRYEPALGVKPQPPRQGIGQILEWKASLPWAIVVSGIAAVAIASINGPSEFLYWQF